MNLLSVKSVHLTGVGGINISAVAKLLIDSGIKVSGSDLKANDQTSILAERGASIHIGEDPAFIPADCDLLVYTSAAPVTNKERVEAKRRKIPELTNFEFLGQWFADKRVVLVTGTHGKSTTTAMLARCLIAANANPTVIVGSKIPDFEDGNFRLGHAGFLVLEGDEYAKHFLAFAPYAIIINNIELDHTDVFPNLERMMDTFRDLLTQIQEGGIIVANLGDSNVAQLLKQEQDNLTQKNIRVVPFNTEDGWHISDRQTSESVELASDRFSEADVVDEVQSFTLISPIQERFPLRLQIPGLFNAVNAMGAIAMAKELRADMSLALESFDTFTGIWRRFESLGVHDGVRIYTDYGHHPTAVAGTLAAAHEAFPQSHIVLCFQPHHRNRTKNFFFDFEASFDAADILVLCEIYDVAGRDAKEDEKISSKDFLDVLPRRDAERGVTRTVEYAATPTQAVEKARAVCRPGDILIVMGAGDIDGAIRKNLTPPIVL